MVNESVNKTPQRGRPSKAKSAPAKKPVAKKEVKDKDIQEVIEKPVEEIKEEEVVEEVVEVKKEVPKKEKRKFEPGDLIPCRSVVSGGLFMDGIMSLMPYTWMDFGDVVDVEYRDLTAAVRNKNGYVMKPFFVIMDDDFVAEYPFLKELYAKQYATKDLAKILTMPIDDMVEEIKTLPGNVKNILKGLASTWIENGNLDSFKRIKALDEVLETDLSLIADMMNE